MMVVDNKFEIGETVYLKIDKDQLPRMIFGFYVDNNGLLYRLIQGVQESNHYDFEISREVNILAKVSD